MKNLYLNLRMAVVSGTPDFLERLEQSCKL